MQSVSSCRSLINENKSVPLQLYTDTWLTYCYPETRWQVWEQLTWWLPWCFHTAPSSALLPLLCWPLSAYSTGQDPQWGDGRCLLPSPITTPLLPLPYKSPWQTQGLKVTQWTPLLFSHLTCFVSRELWDWAGRFGPLAPSSDVHRTLSLPEKCLDVACFHLHPQLPGLSSQT